MDSQPYLAMIPLEPSAKPSEPPEVQPRRRVSSDQIYAAHREARLEARQALKEEAQTEGLLKSRKAVLPSEIRRRERSVDDTHRGRHEDADWQNKSPERRRASRGEEDWDWERPRERGRERNVERIREWRRELGHDGLEERTFRSSQPRQHQSSDPICYQEPQIQQAGPLMHQHHNRQHAAQLQQQDPQMQHKYDHVRQQVESQRQQQAQRQQELELQRHKTVRQQQDSQEKQHPQIHQESEHHRQQQQAPSGHQRLNSAYLQKGSSLPQARHRSTEMSGGSKLKTRTRSMSDIGISQHAVLYGMDIGREASRTGPAPGMANGETGTLDTRVSVAQLRHSYLENANRKPEL